MGSKLISIGCSFTDHRSYPQYKYWDVHLAEYLNLELHNYALSGSCGNSHFYQLIRAIAEHENDIDTIAIGWTQWKRFSFPYISGFEDRLNPPFVLSANSKVHAGLYKLYAYNERLNAIEAVKSAFALMYAVTALADKINAKLLVGNLLSPLHVSKFKGMKWEDLYECTEADDVFWQLQNDKRLIGFPFIPKLGGYYICGGPEWDASRYTVNKIQELAVVDLSGAVVDIRNALRDPEMGSLADLKPNKIIQQKDAHPNQEGHKFIFNKYKDAYDKLYK